MSDVNELMTNVQAELLLVGSFFKKPDLYVTYSKSIRSKYDFSDKAMRFFYDFFEDYYLTFSQEITENKVNNFATQNMDRLKHYKEYGGWQTIYEIAGMADPNDIKNIYNTVKKYALVREYDRNGFPAEKIMSFKDFDKLSPNDVYRLIRAKADKINTNVSSMDEPEVLTDNMTGIMDKYLGSPQFGIPLPWYGWNKHFKGLLPGKVILHALKSNSGKSRFLTDLICYCVLIKKQKFLMLSNEMGLTEIKNCALVTCVNGKEYQAIHGVKNFKTEEELTLGKYRSDDNPDEYIERKINSDGIFVETQEAYISRVKATKDYQMVHKVAQWMETEMEGKFLFKDVTDDYTFERLETEIRKAKVIHDCFAFAYDTAKGSGGLEDWKEIKMSITQLTELAKQLKMFALLNYQLNDESENIKIEDFNSMLLASCRHVRQVVDALLLGRTLRADEYHHYQYIPYESTDIVWGEPAPLDLNENRKYIATKIDKNRMGERAAIMLFEINLNENTWNCIGELVKKG